VPKTSGNALAGAERKIIVSDAARISGCEKENKFGGANGRSNFAKSVSPMSHKCSWWMPLNTGAWSNLRVE
jgi:hypothetical protein